MGDTTHLRELDGDLDDLTPEEARQVPAGAATDCAVMYVMGARLGTEKRPFGDKVVWTLGTGTVPVLDRTGAVRPPRRASRDPAAAHEARQWLRDRLTQQALAACVITASRSDGDYLDATARAEIKVAPHPSAWSKVGRVEASDPMLATARLILALHAKGEL